MFKTVRNDHRIGNDTLVAYNNVERYQCNQTLHSVIEGFTSTDLYFGEIQIYFLNSITVYFLFHEGLVIIRLYLA